MSNMQEYAIMQTFPSFFDLYILLLNAGGWHYRRYCHAQILPKTETRLRISSLLLSAVLPDFDKYGEVFLSLVFYFFIESKLGAGLSNSRT